MKKNLKRSSLGGRLQMLRQQLPTLKQVDQIFGYLFVLVVVCALLGGFSWLAWKAVEEVTARPTVFIDPADGTLAAGEQWEKVHKMTVWSEIASSYVDVDPSSPLWDKVLESGDFNVSYTYDQSGIRFPKVEE